MEESNKIYNNKFEQILSVIKLVLDIIIGISRVLAFKNNISPTQTSLSKYAKFNNLEIILIEYINKVEYMLKMDKNILEVCEYKSFLIKRYNKIINDSQKNIIKFKNSYPILKKLKFFSKNDKLKYKDYCLYLKQFQDILSKPRIKVINCCSSDIIYQGFLDTDFIEFYSTNSFIKNNLSQKYNFIVDNIFCKSLSDVIRNIKWSENEEHIFYIVYSEYKYADYDYSRSDGNIVYKPLDINCNFSYFLKLYMEYFYSELCHVSKVVFIKKNKEIIDEHYFYPSTLFDYTSLKYILLNDIIKGNTLNDYHTLRYSAYNLDDSIIGILLDE
jgi:hypothetical protein